MTKLSQVRGEDYLSLPRLSRDDVKVLWTVDFWDGMISGIVEYKSMAYWAQMCHDYENDDQPFYRRYLVIELSDEEVAEERYWHKLFMEKVGTHPTDVKPKEIWNEFFEPYGKRNPLDLSNNEVTGWFEEPLR
jgi:hypothetical protein